MADDSSSSSSSATDSSDARIDVHDWSKELPFSEVRWVSRLKKTGVLDITGVFFQLSPTQEAGMSISDALVRTRRMFERMLMYLPASIGKREFEYNRGRYVFAMASNDERLNGLVIAHLRRIVTLVTERGGADDESVIERTTLGLDLRYLQLRRFTGGSRRGSRTIVARPRYELLEYELLVSDSTARFISATPQDRANLNAFERHTVERVNALLGLTDECAEQRLRSQQHDACTLLQQAINAGRAVASIGQLNHDLSLARAFHAPRTPGERADDEHVDIETLVDALQTLTGALALLIELIRLPSTAHVRQHRKVVLLRHNRNIWDVILNLAQDDFGVHLNRLASAIEVGHSVASLGATLERLDFSGSRADYVERRNNIGVRADYRRFITHTGERRRRRAIEGYYLMTKRPAEQARFVHVRYSIAGYQLVTVDATGAEVYAPPRSAVVDLSAAYTLLHAENAMRASTFDVYVRRKPTQHPLVMNGSPMAYGIVGLPFGAPLVLRRDVPLYMLRMPIDRSADAHPLYISNLSAEGKQPTGADRVLPELVRGVTSKQVLLIDTASLVRRGASHLFVACANHRYMGFPLTLLRPLPVPTPAPRSLSEVRRAALANTDYRRVIYTSHKHQIALMSIAPDGGIAPERHAARQHFMVVAGSALFTLGDGKPVRLDANGSLTIPANVTHTVRNVGSHHTALKLYTVYTPPQHSPHRVNHLQPPSEQLEVMLTAARDLPPTTALSAGHPDPAPVTTAYHVAQWPATLARFAHENAPFRYARLGNLAVLTTPIDAIAELPLADVSLFLDAPLSLVPSPSRVHTRAQQALYAMARMFAYALPALPTTFDDAIQTRTWDDAVPPLRCAAHAFLLLDAAQQQLDGLVLVTLRQTPVARTFSQSMYTSGAPQLSTTIIIHLLRVRVAASRNVLRDASHLHVDTVHNHVWAGTSDEWHFQSSTPFADEGATRGDTYFALLDTLYRHFQAGQHLPLQRGMPYQGAVASIVHSLRGIQPARAVVLLASYRMLVAEAVEPIRRQFHRSVLMSVGAEVRRARDDSRPIVRRRYGVSQLTSDDITGAAVSTEVRATYLRVMLRAPLGTTSREWLEQVYDAFWDGCVVRRAQAEIDEFLAERSESPPPSTLAETLFAADDDFDMSSDSGSSTEVMIETGAHPARGQRTVIVFLVPHRCVVSERDDPACDARTEQFATVMRAVAESVGFVAQVLVSDKPRAQCDLNRAGGCAHRSSLWTALRTMSKVDYVVEVHSFQRASDFSVPESARSVVLALHEPNSFERRVAVETRSVIIAGSSINALGAEATRLGYPHVLIEVRQDASIATVQRIAAGIASAAKLRQ